MKIIHQAIPEANSLTTSPDGAVDVKADQIVIRASLAPFGEPLSDRASRFPVIVDLGTNADFAIRRSQLDRWTGLRLDRAERNVRVNRVPVVVEQADLWIHGLRGPFSVDVKLGIYVYPDDENPARLPILGLRAILRNKLDFYVDGRRRMVTISKGGWWW